MELQQKLVTARHLENNKTLARLSNQIVNNTQFKEESFKIFKTILFMVCFLFLFEPGSHVAHTVLELLTLENVGITSVYHYAEL